MLEPVRTAGLRIVLAVLIGLMSVGFGTAFADDGSEGTATGTPEPVATSEATTPAATAGDTGADDGVVEKTAGEGNVPEGTLEHGTPTDEPTTPAGTGEDVTEAADEGGIGIMAIDPGTGTMGPGDSVNIAFPSNVQFKDLTTVSATLSDISEEACKLGSPRFTFGLSPANDGSTDGYVPVYLADYPGFTGCGATARVNGENVVGTTEDRWETTTFGGYYVTWDEAVVTVGNYYVTDVMFVVEYGTLTPDNLNVTFKTPSGPGALLGTITVEATFVGTGRPGSDACFKLYDAAGTEVGSERCVRPDDVEEDGKGFVTFDGLPEGTYTVQQSLTPQGYVTDAPQQVTLGAGHDQTVTITNVSHSAVSIKLSSADPAAANTLPADATWTIEPPVGPSLSDTFAEEHRTLPVTITVENPVPVGTYTITIEAGPTFETYTMEVTIDSPTETIEIALIPADDIDAIVAELVAVLIQILEEILAGS